LQGHTVIICVATDVEYEINVTDFL
jgi:hypothetical protein